MRLDKMFSNVLDFTLEQLTTKVEIESAIRAEKIQQAESKIDFAPKAKATVKLDDHERAILKALGLTMKDLKLLRGTV